VTTADKDRPGGVYITAKLRKEEAMIEVLRGLLYPGECLLGLFAVTKISPSVSALAVTSQRLLAFEDAILRNGQAVRYAAEIPVDDVSSFTVTGLMDKVAVERSDKSRTKLGILDREADKPHLLAAVKSAQSLARAGTAGPPGVTYAPAPEQVPNDSPESTQPGAAWPIEQPTGQWPVYDAPGQASSTGSEPEPPVAPVAVRASRSVPTAPPASAKMAALEELITRARNGEITADEEAAARRRLFGG